MSGSWDNSTNQSINMTVGGVAAAGTGPYTVVVFVQTAASGNSSWVSGMVSAAIGIEILSDSGVWFGAGDFSSGFGAAAASTWYMAGQSKATGSQTYREYLCSFGANGSSIGSPSHGVSTGAGTHANPGTLTAIKLGFGDDKGNGLLAFVAIWKRVISDAEFDSLCTHNLSDVAALLPDALITLNNWNGTTGATDVVGTASQSSITGAVQVGANPTGYSFTLTAATSPQHQPYISSAPAVTARTTPLVRRSSLIDDPKQPAHQPVISSRPAIVAPTRACLRRSSYSDAPIQPARQPYIISRPAIVTPTAAYLERGTLADPVVAPTIATPQPIVSSRPIPPAATAAIIGRSSQLIDPADTPQPLIASSTRISNPGTALLIRGTLADAVVITATPTPGPYVVTAPARVTPTRNYITSSPYTNTASADPYIVTAPARVAATKATLIRSAAPDARPPAAPALIVSKPARLYTGTIRLVRPSFEIEHTGPGRDAPVRMRPPELAWRVGQPRLGWDLAQPGTAWNAGEPRHAWQVDDVSTDLTLSAPRID